MRKVTTGARHALGEPWDSKLNALCEVFDDAPRTGIIRQAVLAYIEQRLKGNPELRARYEAAYRKRMKISDPKVAILPTGK